MKLKPNSFEWELGDRGTVQHETSSWKIPTLIFVHYLENCSELHEQNFLTSQLFFRRNKIIQSVRPCDENNLIFYNSWS